VRIRPKTLIIAAIIGLFGAGVGIRVGERPGFATIAPPQIVVGKGPGSQAMVRTFFSDGSATVPFAQPTLVYPAGFRGGAYVAIGDVDNNGNPDIITGAQAGGGSHVRIFEGFSGNEIFGFFAFPAGFSGGVRVASGDLNDDAYADVIVGAGPGGGSHVRVFDGQDLSEGTLTELIGFFAYPDGFAGGVFVGAADVDEDGSFDVITGAGEGGGPHVRVFDGASAGTGVLSEVYNFFPFQSGFSGGVRVAGGDADGDFNDDIIVGAGPGGGPHVRVMDGTDPNVSLLDLFPYAGGFAGGVFVGAYDKSCGLGELGILTGAGAGGGPHVRSFDATGAPLLGFFPFEGEFTGGVKVGGQWTYCN
jgi:hypothetical protein